jgi:hypothetical protein
LHREDGCSNIAILNFIYTFLTKWGKNSDAIYWHAETRAIHNFIRRHDVNLLQKATIMVARIKRPFERSKDFVAGMARPCKGCFSCIRDFGVPRIAYTDESGAFVCEVASTA